MVHKKRIKKPSKDEDGDVDDMEDIEDVNMDAVTDSEEEYTETEKKLLEKVRKQHITENFDSDDEVYGLQNSEEEDDEEDGQQDSMESDIEGLQEEDDDIPNDRAWGNKARTFYSSDFKYTDYANAPQKDLDNADIEEQEGRRLHLRAMGQHITTDDSIFTGIVQTIEDSESNKQIKDNRQISDEESFMFTINVFKKYMTEAKDILAPFLKLVENGTCPDCDAVAFVKTKYQLILNYCTNVSFYLMLNVKGKPVLTHPVLKRLAQYNQLLDQLKLKQGNLLEQVTEIVKAIKEDKPLYSIEDDFQIQTNKKTPEVAKLSKRLTHQKEAEKQNKQLLDDSINEEINMDEANLDMEEKNDNETIDDEKNNTILDTTNEEEGKRAITYQMAKNRGLTPYRKKELRNPRVKHRNKYRKAKIRRKGAIREVRKEITRYGGEISGIKVGVKKGIKLK